MFTRSSLLCTCLLALACTPSPGGSEALGESTSAAGSTGTSESAGTSESGASETGEEWPECVSENAFTSFSIDVEPLVLGAWTRTCTVVLVDEHRFTLNCPEQDMVEQLYEVEAWAIAPESVDLLPLSEGQELSFEVVGDESWIVRDLEGRLLLAAYDGELAPAQVPAFDLSPLSLELAEQLCPIDCEDTSGPGVPPECACREQLALRVLAAGEVDAALVVSGSRSPVPGGELALEAQRRSDCFEGPDQERFALLYIATPG